MTISEKKKSIKGQGIDSHSSKSISSRPPVVSKMYLPVKKASASGRYDHDNNDEYSYSSDGAETNDGSK